MAGSHFGRASEANALKCPL